ncbi:MAG: DUF488 domain-containing protein [Verrucomicrobiae bacterium]
MIATLPQPKRMLTRPVGRPTATTLFYTIGYEQNEPTAFLKLLRSHRIDVVVDVRQMPLSRKRGFSKNQLRELLAEEGIDYLHMQTLGAPKPIRDRLRENGSWWEYVKGYEKVLAGRGEEILTLIDCAKNRRICLLCFERKPEECHRSLVARDMEKRANGSNLRVEHIRY